MRRQEPLGERLRLGSTFSVANPPDLARMRQAGIACIELNLHPLDVADLGVRAKAIRIVEEARGLGLDVWSVHIPFGVNWDPSSPDEEIRAGVVEKVRAALEFAGEMGVGIAVFHPSWEPIEPAERAERLAICKRSLGGLASDAARVGVRLAVECLPRTCLGHSADEIEWLIADEPGLGVCVDVNHLFREAPERFIERLGSRIITTHISDNDGADEKHWMPGTGVLDWTGILGALDRTGYAGAIMHEVRVQEPEELADTYRRLLRAYETGRPLVPLLALTEQASSQIVVVDPLELEEAREGEGESGRARSAAWRWQWSPGADGADVPGWGLPSDVKLRTSAALGGGQWIVAADSRGLAVLAPYPAGRPIRWSCRVGGNPHAVELLPDGNVAVAASDGGWVRVYAASQGADCADYAEFTLPGAHGVLWDPDRGLLWAVGDRKLVAFRVEGTSAQPELLQARTAELPTSWGHDLAPVYGNLDRLWVTTNTGVYQYSKEADVWLTAYPGSEAVNGPFVKSVGNVSSGMVFTTAPREGNMYAWGTDTVEAAGSAAEDRWAQGIRWTIPGTAIYKARVWRSEYQ